MISEVAVVKLEAAWPDYVFTPDYSLRTMEELAQFITINGHLPGVPRAQEIKEEGQKLGENQVILLEKVEELTLYIIELNKKLAQTQEELNALKNK